MGDQLVIHDDRLGLRRPTPDGRSLLLRGVAAADGGNYSCGISSVEYKNVITHRVEVVGECRY